MFYYNTDVCSQVYSFFFFKQKTAYEMRISDWSSDVCSSDLNVIVHNNPGWRNAVRIGGDLNGRSQGRVRMVNNTVLFTNSGQANAVMVQLGAGSLEMHNNVIYQAPAGSSPAIVRENPASNVSTPYCGPQSREP